VSSFVGLTMGERKVYSSDLTNEQREAIGPFLQGWKARHPSISGHAGRYELRKIVNAIFIKSESARRSVGLLAA
jgi:hypothetical protein